MASKLQKQDLNRNPFLCSEGCFFSILCLFSFLPGGQFLPTELWRRAPGPWPWAQRPQPPAEDPTGWPETQLCPPAALTGAQPRRQLRGPALPGPWRPLCRFLPEAQEDFLRVQCQRCSRACTKSLLGFLVFLCFFFFLFFFPGNRKISERLC